MLFLNLNCPAKGRLSFPGNEATIQTHSFLGKINPRTKSPADLTLFSRAYRKAVSSKLRNFRLWMRPIGVSRSRSIARMPICKWRLTCVL